MRAALRRAHVRNVRKPSRTALLALIVSLGIVATALVVASALLTGPRHDEAARFPTPLNVHPVVQTTAGPCLAGTRGVTGQSATGPICHQLAEGIAIRKVNDIRVQRGPGGDYEISIGLLPADRRAFADLTHATVGGDVAFVTGDRLVTVTRVETPVTQGEIIISGNFARSDADRFIRELKGSR